MKDGEKIMLNISRYKDLIAYVALEKITKEEKELNDKVRITIKVIKLLLDLNDFELIERIQIKDKKTSKIFR